MREPLREPVSALAEQRGAPFRGLIGHTLIYGSGYVTMALVSAVLIPVYMHHLTASAFGLLALMLVLYGFMKQVYDLGFMNSVGRFFFDCKGDSAERDLRQMRSTTPRELLAPASRRVRLARGSTWSAKFRPPNFRRFTRRLMS